MGTKNNPKNRGKIVEKKKHNNKEVEPMYYYGVHAGHGKYMAAKYIGSAEIAVDSDKRPVQWDQL